jgi:DNA-binding PadR family transcriptional regulator
MNDLLLLAALLEGPKHGYALKKHAGLIAGQADMHNNLVYPALRKFVERGWVTKKKAAGERGQTRQVYALTQAGQQWIVGRICDFGEGAAASADEFHLRVGLFPILTIVAREEILEKRKAYLLGRTRRFVLLRRQMQLGRYGMQVVRFMVRQWEAELVWIEQLRRLNRRTRPVSDTNQR